MAGVDPATVARVFASYEDAKRAAGRMDMEDVLLCAAAVLAEDERVAAEVRRQYTHFVVDEFQDVSPIQSALLDLWLGGRDEICVVGDPAQTIYSFAGASARYLLDFPQKHRGTTSIELVRNYRSTPQVIEAANTLLARSDTGAVRLRAAAAGRPGRALPRARRRGRGGASRWRRRSAGSLDDGMPAGEVAVLFRINAQSEAFEEALAARSIPYVVRGAERFFQRAEVRQAVTLLRGAARSARGRRWPRRRARRADQGRGGRDGVDARGAHGPGQRPGPVGVAAGAHRPRRQLRGGEPRTRPWATSSTTSTAGRPSSTPRSPTG